MCGGGNPLSVVTNAIEDVASGVGNVVGGAVDFVTEHPLESALLAAGVYYAPEIGAYLSSDGAVLGATEAEAAANAGLAPVVDSSAAIGASGAGAGAGLTAEELAAANLTADPIAAANQMAGWTAADSGYLSSIGAPAAIGAGAAAAGLGAGGTTAADLAAAGAGAGVGAGVGNTIKDVLTAGAIGSGIAGIAGAGAAKDAAQLQADAAVKAAAQQQANFELINKQQAPYRAAGYNALSNLGALGTGQYQMYDAAGNPTGMGTGSGYLQHQFDATDLAKGLAPNYDFMLQQGQMANQRAANVGGGALSGNTLQGLQKFTQDYAGNAYQNAFQNYQTQRNNIYNTLAGIAGIGQTGQTAANTAATNATNAATQLGVGSAAAQAAGTIGQTGAYTGAINNALNNYTLASLLSQGGRVA